MPHLQRPLPEISQLSGPLRGYRSTRHFRIPADPSQLQVAREYVDEAAVDFGLWGADRYEFVFAVNEAVTNAVRHGAPYEDGTIALRIQSTDDTLICSVLDKGQFAAAQSVGSEMAEGGRGLTFMAMLTDEIKLSSSPSGTTVRLCKRRPAAPAKAR